MWTPDCSLKMEAVCPICLDFYSNPGYLSWIHVFCFDWTKNWMARKEDLILTCSMCREENQRHILHEWVFSELLILTEKHGSLGEQQIVQITGPLGLCSEDMALEDETGESSLVPFNDLRHLCCGKPGNNLAEDPQDSPFWAVSQTALLFPWSARKLMWGSSKSGLQVSVRSQSAGGTLIITWWKTGRLTTLACVPDSSQVSFIWHWEMDEGKGHTKSSVCISFVDPLVHSLVLNNQWEVTVVPHLNIFLWVIQPFLGCRRPSSQEGWKDQGKENVSLHKTW